MERFFSHEPVRAVKQAVWFDGYYMPLFGFGIFEPGVWYDAEQKHDGQESSPTACYPGCIENLDPEFRHGFYGWKPEFALANWLRKGTWVEVEFAGVVVEHERGYRAQRQLILRELSAEEAMAFARPEQVFKRLQADVERLNKAVKGFTESLVEFENKPWNWTLPSLYYHAPPQEFTNIGCA